jgi:hypothetical protein
MRSSSLPSSFVKVLLCASMKRSLLEAYRATLEALKRDVVESRRPVKVTASFKDNVRCVRLFSLKLAENCTMAQMSFGAIYWTDRLTLVDIFQDIVQDVAEKRLQFGSFADSVR